MLYSLRASVPGCSPGSRAEGMGSLSCLRVACLKFASLWGCLMAIALALLSLLPVLVGFIATGDFPQLLVKPSRSLVFWAFHYRYGLLALSVVLYLAALLLHLTVAPTSLVLLIVVGVLLVGLAANAFFAVPYAVFPTVR